MKKLRTTLLFACATIIGCTTPDITTQTSQPHATLYTSKEIITLNPNQPSAQAIAISGDDILAVGSVDDIKRELSDYHITLDTRFSDKVLVPGFINQHEHPWLAGLTLSTNVISIEDWHLPGKSFPRAASADQYQQRLKDAVAAHSSQDDFFFSWGYHQLWHGDLNRGMLDAISDQVPIIVWHRSAHELIFNSAALDKLGINQASIDQFPEVAKTQLSLEHGHFWEQGAIPLIPKFFGALATPERYLPALDMVKRYWHSAGSTMVNEPGGLVNRNMQLMQNRVFAGEDSPFRMNYIADGKTMVQQHLDGDILGETEALLSWGDGMSQFLPKQVKLFTDGAMFSQLMQMKDGYLDGHHGEWIINPEKFAKAFQIYWDAGYQIHVHQNGDEGLELLLDTVEENQQRNPRKDHRTVIVHFGFSDPDQVKRIAELGLIVSANPYYTVALADHYSEHGLGHQRAQEMVRLGDVAEAGIPFSLHADMPMAPGQPLYLMWSAVNRNTLEGNSAGPDQRISAEQALRAITIEAAYSLKMEDKVGSIENGKLANLTVLNESPLNVDPMKIKDIEVWGTIHEGRVMPVLQ